MALTNLDNALKVNARSLINLASAAGGHQNSALPDQNEDGSYTLGGRIRKLKDTAQDDEALYREITNLSGHIGDPQSEYYKPYRLGSGVSSDGDPVFTEGMQLDLGNLKNKVANMVNQGYSDEDIINSYKQSYNNGEYPFLTQADSGDAPLTTEETDYIGTDTPYAYIRKARNPEDDESDNMSSFMAYCLGEDTNSPDDQSDASYDPQSKYYNPYAHGSTYFATENDGTALAKAKINSTKAQKELQQLSLYVFQLATKNKMTPSEIEAILTSVIEGENKTYLEKYYPTLGRMEMYRKSGTALPLYEPVNFALPYFIDSLKDIAKPDTYDRRDSIPTDPNTGNLAYPSSTYLYTSNLTAGIGDYLKGNEVDNEEAKAFVDKYPELFTMGNTTSEVNRIKTEGGAGSLFGTYLTYGDADIDAGYTFATAEKFRNEEGTGKDYVDNNRLGDTFYRDVLNPMNDLMASGALGLNNYTDFLTQCAALIDYADGQGKDVDTLYDEGDQYITGAIDTFKENLLGLQEKEAHLIEQNKLIVGEQYASVLAKVMSGEELNASEQTLYGRIYDTDIREQVKNDKGYLNATSNLHTYAENYITENTQIGVSSNGYTNGTTLDLAASTISGLATAYYDYIMKLATYLGASFDETVKYMGLDLDEVGQKAVEYAFNEYNEAINYVMDAYKTAFENSVYGTNYLENLERAHNEIIIGEEAEEEGFYVDENGDIRNRYDNPKYNLTYTPEEAGATVGKIDDEQYERLKSLYNSLNGSGVAMDVLQSYGVNGYEGLEAQYVDKAYEDIKSQQERFRKGETGEIVATGSGWHPGYTLLKGGQRGVYLHIQGYVESAYFLTRRDDDYREAEMRYRYTPQECRQFLQNTINGIDNDTLRKELQYQLDSYEGDIYNFSFDPRSANLRSLAETWNERVRVLDETVAKNLTPTEYTVYKGLGTAVNSSLSILETAGLQKITGLVVGAEAFREATTLQNMINVLGLTFTMGMSEGLGSMGNEIMDNGGSKFEASLKGWTYALATGLIENFWDGVASHYLHGTGTVSSAANQHYKIQALGELMFGSGKNRFKDMVIVGLSSVADLGWEALKEIPNEIAQEETESALYKIIKYATPENPFAGISEFNLSEAKETALDTAISTPFQTLFFGAGPIVRESRNTVRQGNAVREQVVNDLADNEAEYRTGMEQLQKDIDEAEQIVEYLDSFEENYEKAQLTIENAEPALKLLDANEIQQLKQLQLETKQAQAEFDDASVYAEQTAQTLSDLEQELNETDIPTPQQSNQYSMAWQNDNTAKSKLAEKQGRLSEAQAAENALSEKIEQRKEEIITEAREQAEQQYKEAQKERTAKFIRDKQAEMETLKAKHSARYSEIINGAAENLLVYDKGQYRVADEEAGEVGKPTHPWYITSAAQAFNEINSSLFDNYAQKLAEEQSALADMYRATWSDYTVVFGKTDQNVEINHTDKTITLSDEASISDLASDLTAEAIVQMAARDNSNFELYANSLITEAYTGIDGKANLEADLKTIEEETGKKGKEAVRELVLQLTKDIVLGDTGNVNWFDYLKNGNSFFANDVRRFITMNNKRMRQTAKRLGGRFSSLYRYTKKTENLRNQLYDIAVEEETEMTKDEVKDWVDGVNTFVEGIRSGSEIFTSDVSETEAYEVETGQRFADEELEELFQQQEAKEAQKAQERKTQEELTKEEKDRRFAERIEKHPFDVTAEYIIGANQSYIRVTDKEAFKEIKSFYDYLSREESSFKPTLGYYKFDGADGTNGMDYLKFSLNSEEKQRLEKTVDRLMGLTGSALQRKSTIRIMGQAAYDQSRSVLRANLLLGSALVSEDVAMFEGDLFHWAYEGYDNYLKNKDAINADIEAKKAQRQNTANTTAQTTQTEQAVSEVATQAEQTTEEATTEQSETTQTETVQTESELSNVMPPLINDGTGQYGLPEGVDIYRLTPEIRQAIDEALNAYYETGDTSSIDEYNGEVYRRNNPGKDASNILDEAYQKELEKARNEAEALRAENEALNQEISETLAQYNEDLQAQKKRRKSSRISQTETVEARSENEQGTQAETQQNDSAFRQMTDEEKARSEAYDEAVNTYYETGDRSRLDEVEQERENVRQAEQEQTDEATEAAEQSETNAETENETAQEETTSKTDETAETTEQAEAETTEEAEATQEEVVPQAEQEENTLSTETVPQAENNEQNSKAKTDPRMYSDIVREYEQLKETLSYGKENLDKKSYSRLVGMMYGASLTFAATTKGYKGLALVTPLNALRLLANEVGTHVYENVNQYAVDDNGEIAEGVSRYNERTNAISAGTLGSQYSTMLYGIMKTVDKELKTRTPGGFVPRRGVSFEDFFYSYMSMSDKQLEKAGLLEDAKSFEAMAESFSLKGANGKVYNLGQSLKTRRNQLVRWYYDQTNMERINSFMRNYGDVKSNPFGIQGPYGQLRQLIVDSANPAKFVDRWASKQTGEKVDDLERAMYLKPYRNKTSTGWVNGHPVTLDGQRTGAKSFEAICRQYKIDRKSIDDFAAYMTAVEVLDRMMDKEVDEDGNVIKDKNPFTTDEMPMVLSEGFKNIAPTEENVRQYIADIEAMHPEYVEAAQEWHNTWDSFMQNIVVNEGLMTQDNYNLFKQTHPHYVPLRRYETKTVLTSPAVGHSNEQIVNPVETMLLRVGELTRYATQNRAARAFDEIYERTENMGFWADQVTQAEIEAGLKEKPTGDNVVTVYRKDGSKVYYTITDPGLLSLFKTDAFKRGADAIKNNKFFKVFEGVTRWVSRYATNYNPIFTLIRNPLRDYQTSVDYGTWSSNFLTALPKWLETAVDVSKQKFADKGSEVVKEYFDRGGAGYTYLRGVDQTQTVKELKRAVAGSNAFLAAKDAIVRVLSFEDLSDIIETTSRAVEYKYGREAVGTAEGKGGKAAKFMLNWGLDKALNSEALQGFKESKIGSKIYENLNQTGEVTETSKERAFLNSREVTVDFARGGEGTVYALLKAAIPFFGPTVQGIDRALRQLTPEEGGLTGRAGVRLVKTVINTSVSAMVSVALMMGYFKKELDDDDLALAQLYADLSDELKYGNILIPIYNSDGSREVKRLPVAQDPNIKMTYAMAARFFEQYMTPDGVEPAVQDDFFTDLLEAFYDAYIEPFASMRTSLAPIADIMRNESYWGTPIVGSAAERGRNITQSQKTTPEIFNKAAKFTNLVFGWIPVVKDSDLEQALESPIKLQYLWEQYTGMPGKLLEALLTKNRATGEWDPALVGYNVRKQITNPLTLDLDTSSDIEDYYDSLYDMIDTVAYETYANKGFGYLDDTLSQEERQKALDELSQFTKSNGIIAQDQQQIKEYWKTYYKLMAINYGGLSREDARYLRDLTKNDIYQEGYQISFDEIDTIIEAQVYSPIKETYLHSIEWMEDYRYKYMRGTQTGRLLAGVAEAESSNEVVDALINAVTNQPVAGTSAQTRQPEQTEQPVLSEQPEQAPQTEQLEQPVEQPVEQPIEAITDEAAQGEPVTEEQQQSTSARGSSTGSGRSSVSRSNIQSIDNSVQEETQEEAQSEASSESATPVSDTALDEALPALSADEVTPMSDTVSTEAQQSTVPAGGTEANQTTVANSQQTTARSGVAPISDVQQPAQSADASSATDAMPRPSGEQIQAFRADIERRTGMDYDTWLQSFRGRGVVGRYADELRNAAATQSTASVEPQAYQDTAPLQNAIGLEPVQSETPTQSAAEYEPLPFEDATEYADESEAATVEPTATAQPTVNYSSDKTGNAYRDSLPKSFYEDFDNGETYMVEAQRMAETFPNYPKALVPNVDYTFKVDGVSYDVAQYEAKYPGTMEMYEQWYKEEYAKRAKNVYTGSFWSTFKQSDYATQVEMFNKARNIQYSARSAAQKKFDKWVATHPLNDD